MFIYTIYQYNIKYIYFFGFKIKLIFTSFVDYGFKIGIPKYPVLNITIDS